MTRMLDSERYQADHIFKSVVKHAQRILQKISTKLLELTSYGKNKSKCKNSFLTK